MAGPAADPVDELGERETSATDDGADGTASRMRRLPSFGRPRMLWSVAALITAALLALGIVLSVHLDRADPLQSAQHRKAGAVAAGKATVLDLISVKSTTAQADIQRLLARTTSTFRSQFAAAAKSFQQTLAAGRVTSTGSVTAAGVSSLKGDTATLLIAATATVKNSTSPQGQARSYRFRLTMVEQSGRWLVGGVGFVA